MGILQKCFGGGCSSASSSSGKQPYYSTTIEHLCHRFSLSQLRKLTHNFDQSRIIGEGSHDIVYRASMTSINGQLKHVAVKCLRPKLARSQGALLYYKNEIIFLCQLDHPNLVSLVGFCDDENELIAVYDYAPKGSLFYQLFEKSPPTLVPWKKRLEISIGVARGLHYLHSGTKRTILHLNTATANILLDENWIPKLTSFGSSLKGPKFSAKVVEPEDMEYYAHSHRFGTLGYYAPEYFLGTIVSHKSDVYSFGVVLLELLCGKTPLEIIREHNRLRNLARMIGNGEGIIDQSLVGQVAGECLKLYMDITESCLSEDRNERPDMGDVEVQLEHVLQLQEEADAKCQPLI